MLRTDGKKIVVWHGDDQGEYSYLRSDPDEFHNVADDPAYGDVRQELDDRLWAWLEDVNDPILTGPTRTPTYHEAVADHQARQRSRG